MERNSGHPSLCIVGRHFRVGLAGGVRSALCGVGKRLAFPAVVLASATAMAQDNRFPADAVVNVTLAPYNVVPNDGKDDTAGLQRAITDNVGTGRVIYLPAGVYDVSDSLVAKNAQGVWEAHLTLQGQSYQKTIVKLKDHCPGFEQPATPRAVFVTASHWEPGDKPDGGGNKAFRNNIWDITVDIGRANSGAVGIDYAVSNWGSIENVVIKSGDGAGVAGVSMRRSIPGPGYIQNLRVEGFDVGLDVGDLQYGLTVFGLTVNHQRVAGVRTDQNVLSIQGLVSENSVPAVVVTRSEGVLTLLNTNLAGGAADQFAIDCAGTLLLRSIEIKGYRPSAVRCQGKEVGGAKIDQWYWPGGSAVPGPSTALLTNLPGSRFQSADLKNWIAVGPRNTGETDDTAAIQRAIDSGKSTVYFPKDRTYFLSDTVIVRGAVSCIEGMGAEISLGAAKEPFSDVAHPRPLFRIDPVAGAGVEIDNLFLNAQYPGEVIFENNSPKALAICHCGGWVGSQGHRRSYRNTPAATKGVFVQDCFLPGWSFTRQTVKAYQLNPENPDGDGVEPQVLNDGGKLWILGFKTEGPGPFIATRSGGVTELLGAYNYISATQSPTVPKMTVPYPVVDATASLTFTADNFRDNDYEVYVRKTAAGKVVKEWKRSDLPPRNGNPGDRSICVPLLTP